MLAFSLRWTLLLAIVTTAASPCFCEDLLPAKASNTAADVNPEARIAALRDELAQCRSELKRVRESAKSIEAEDSAQNATGLDAELDLWTRLELILSQRLSMLEQVPSIEERGEHWREQLDQLQRVGLSEPRPYSYLLLESTRDDLRIEEERGENIRQEIESKRSLLASSRSQFDDRESTRRRIKEELEGTSDAAEVEELTRELELAQLASRVTEEEIQQYRELLVTMQERLKGSNARVRFLQAKVLALKTGVRFSQEDLDRQLKLVEFGETRLRTRLNKLQSQLQGELQSEDKGDSSDAAPIIEDPHGDELDSLVVDSTQQEILLIQQLLEELAVARETWKRRFALFNSQAPEDLLPQWLEDTSVVQDRLQHLARQTRLQLEEYQKEAMARLKTTGPISETPDQTHSAEDIAHQTELRNALQFYNNTLVLIEEIQRLQSRCAEELQAKTNPISLTEMAASVFEDVDTVWHYELAAIDDRQITVGKIVSGLLLAAIGFLLAGVVSRFIGRRLLPRLGVNRGGATAVQSVVFYSLVVLFSLIALELVNVPLTVFAFLGGAVAIGFGFGSQNILNNFISGLILLVERPIRVGDLVNVDGFDATIEQIGARSTRVRTGDNRDILVPNSKFLENNVTNWTLSDTRIRKYVSVGVAYGSPVKLVTEVLEESVRGNSKVLASPGPVVLFRDFGDSSLVFEAHFWIHMRTMMEGAIVESEIRQAVDEAFRMNNITIAFPQRDIHLNMESPMEVQMLPAVPKSNSNTSPTSFSTTAKIEEATGGRDSQAA